MGSIAAASGAWAFGAPKRGLNPLWRARSTASSMTRRPGAGHWPSCTTGFGVHRSESRTAHCRSSSSPRYSAARRRRRGLRARVTFMPAWTPSHAERLLRSPDWFQIRRCSIDGLRQVGASPALPKCCRCQRGREPALLDVVRRARAVRCGPDALRPPDLENLRAGSEHPRSLGPRPRAGATPLRRTPDGLRVSAVRPESTRSPAPRRRVPRATRNGTPRDPERLSRAT